jgi:hypothetical protein
MRAGAIEQRANHEREKARRISLGVGLLYKGNDFAATDLA